MGVGIRITQRFNNDCDGAMEKRVPGQTWHLKIILAPIYDTAIIYDFL